MAWYNPFSWGESTIENIVDKDSGLLTQVGNWIGNMDLTDEEIVEFNKGTIESVNEHVRATLSEKTGRSQTRRFISKVWVLMVVLIILAVMVTAPFDRELSVFYFNLLSTDLIVNVTVAICIFFYGSYGVVSVIDKVKK